MIGKVNVGGAGSLPFERYRIKANENIPPKSYVTLDGKLCPSEYNVSTTVNKNEEEYVDSRNPNFTYQSLVGNERFTQLWFNEHIKIVSDGGKTNFVIYHSDGSIEIIDTGNIPYDTYWMRGLSMINPQYYVIPCRDMVVGSTESLKYFQVYKMEGESVTLEYESSKNTSNDCCFFYLEEYSSWFYNPTNHVVYTINGGNYINYGSRYKRYVVTVRECSSSGLSSSEWQIVYDTFISSWTSGSSIQLLRKIGDIFILSHKYGANYYATFPCKMDIDNKQFVPAFTRGINNGKNFYITDDSTSTTKYICDVSKGYFTLLKENTYLVQIYNEKYCVFEWDGTSVTSDGLLVSNIRILSELKHPSIFSASPTYVNADISPIAKKGDEFYYKYQDEIIVYKLADTDLYIDREIDINKFYFDVASEHDVEKASKFSMMYDNKFLTSFDGNYRIMQLENAKYASAYCKDGGEEGSMIDVQRFI